MKHNQQRKPKEVRTEKKIKICHEIHCWEQYLQKKNATFTDIYNNTDFSHTGSKREFRVE